jgi:uncharacterized repeat protein (TIGR01451 family)
MMRTLFVTWFAPDSFPPRKRRTAGRPARRSRWRVPRLEWLEDRIVPNTYFVAPTGNDGNNGITAPFLTIQHALNVAAANPGPDTINVAPGTYQEQLTINDPSMVTLTGADAANTIIKSPPTLSPDASGRQVIVEMASPANVVMSGFTVEGPTSSVIPTDIGIDFGILAVGAGTLDLSATTVTAIHGALSITGQQTGHGIGVGDSATNRIGFANIHGVTVTDYNKSGIRITGAGTTATITGNTVTGSGPTSAIGQNGITISAGGVATVTGNTVSANEFTGTNSGPDPFTNTEVEGIIDLGGGDGVTIAGNNVFNNDIGIYSASLASPSPVSITGNTVHDNRFDGVFLEAGIATASNNTIFNNPNGLVVLSFDGRTQNSVATVTGNTIFSNSEKGVWVVDESDTGAFPIVTVFQNTINNNGTGVVVGGGPPGTTQSQNDHTIISQNSIFANSPGIGIDLNDDGVTLNQPGGTRPGPNNFVNFPVLTQATIEGPNLDLEGFARPGSVIELFIADPDPTGFGQGKTYLVTLTEGSAADLDNTTGSYGPGPVNGLVQGSDTTNRFRFVIPLASLPAPVAAGAVLTSTATLDDQFTSEFSGNITVTQLPPPSPPPPPPEADVSLTKQVNQTNSIFGTPVTFTLIVHNNGPDTATGVVATDVLPAGLVFVSATPSQGSFDAGSGRWTIGTLANGASATLQITSLVAVIGPVTNTASVTALQADPDPANNVSSETMDGLFSAEQVSKRLFLSSSDPPNTAMVAAEEAMFNAWMATAVNLWEALWSVAQSLLAARNDPGPGNGGVALLQGTWFG